MTGQASDNPEGTARTAPKLPVRWKTWPASDQFPASLLVLVFVVLMAGLVAWAVDAWLAGAGACLIVSWALARYWLPTEYMLTQRGVGWRRFGRWVEWNWTEVNAYKPISSGIILFHRDQVRPIDVLGGLLIPCGPAPDQLNALVAQCCPNARQLQDRSRR